MFPEHVERSFLDPEYSFVAIRRILPTGFAKKSSPNCVVVVVVVIVVVVVTDFCWFNWVRRILPTRFAKKCSPN